MTAAAADAGPLEVELPPAPYPGLRPFEFQEWPIFFGREPMIRDVITRLLERNLVVVHGDSGCGKSSLIRAGVLVHLEQQHERGNENWRTCVMLPREAPLRNFAEALASLDGDEADRNRIREVRRCLNLGRNAPEALASLIRRGKHDHVCILVDQFEELFSFARQHGRDEAELFVDILVGLQQNPPEGLYAIVAMRSEFLGVCARFKGLAEAVNQTQYLVPQMERPALLRAIREPATLYEGEVSRELAERLIADAGGGQDQLPLMQHGLMVLWRREIGAPTGLEGFAEDAAPFRHESGPDDGVAPLHLGASDVVQRPSYSHDRGPSWRLELEDYRDAGGLAELLSRHADDVMAEAAPDPRRQKIVEHLFRALTDINAEGSAVRRPQTLAKLMAVTGSNEATLRRIIDIFRAEGVSFLTPYGDAPIGPDSLIDISHEALIRCWRKIAEEKEGWLQREFRDRLIWQSLRIQAGRFAENEKEILSPAATEYHDAWLSALPNNSWTERYEGGWDGVQALMAASREEAQRQRERETARRQEAEARTRVEKERAEEQRRQAEARAEEEKERANREARLARDAEKQRQIAQAAEKRRTQELFGSRLTHAALLAEGEKYARAREVLEESRELDGQIALERRHARDFLARYVGIMGGGAQQVYEGAAAQLVSVAVSPDGALLATVGENGTAVLFDINSGAIRQRLEGHTGDVYDVAFDPAGAWLVTGDNKGKIIRWSLPADGAPAKPLQAWQAPAGVWSVAVSPDGQLLATGGPDNDISLWKAETGKLVRRLQGHEGEIAAFGGLAFSPSGQRLASASYDRTARVWNVETGESMQIFRGHSDRVYGVVFAVDNSQIATTSATADRRAVLWDVESGRPVRVFAGHANSIFGIKYLSRGSQPDAASTDCQQTRRYLVTGSFDRTLRLWDIDTGVTLRVSEGHLAGATGVAVHTPKEPGTATRVFSASNDGTVRRWDIASLPHQHLFDVPGKALGAAIAPAGTHVAVGFDDGSLRIYALPEGHLADEVENAHDASAHRLDFAADGAALASASYDKSAKLWSVAADGKLALQEAFTGHNAGLHGIAFSPDGKTLATASDDGRVGLFKVGSADKGTFIDAHKAWAQSVAFDAAGTRILSAGYEDKTARLWDLTTDPPSLIRAFADFPQELLWAALSPDDQLVAIVGRGNVVNIYRADDRQLLHRLVGHEQTVYRAVFSPDGAQLATVSSDATVRLWNLDTGAQLFALRLPADRAIGQNVPLWDFDFRCTPKGCWLAVPLTRGKLALYDLGPYAE